MTERPFISNALVGHDSSPEEAFQNSVLRPIIKMKHELLIAYTKQAIAKRKKDFASIDQKSKIKYLISCFEQDSNFKSELRGIIIGHFTLEELQLYQSIENSMNKRITNIIRNRIIDHLDLLA